MAYGTLNPYGSDGTTFNFTSPTQTAGNEYLNIDEGMDAPDVNDFVRSTQNGAILACQFGALPASLEGEINEIICGFSYNGTPIAQEPGAAFQLFLDGIAVTDSKVVSLDSSGANTTGEVVWNTGEFQDGLTFDDFNAATTREIKVVLASGAGHSKPPIYHPTEEPN